MTTRVIFTLQMVLGYVAWLMVFRLYLLPRLKRAGPFEAQRAIAALHSFRFLGLAFFVPGVVGPLLPRSFAAHAAYGDFITGMLALLAVLSSRVRPAFWTLLWMYSVVGFVDILVAYYYAARTNLPAVAGQLGVFYVIPVLLVPLLMVTNWAALYWLVRPPVDVTSPEVAR